MKNAFRFAALTGLTLATVHCSDGARLAPSSTTTTTTSSQSGRAALATFTARVDHQANTIHFDRVVPAGTEGSKITPESLNSVSDPQNQNGVPSSGTVDLVSTNCVDGYPTTKTFSCDVELISGFTRDLANVYVQISNATLNGSTTSAYDATNSTTELNTKNDGTLTVDHGLWSYNNANVKAKAVYPVIASEASGDNTATVTWDLSNPTTRMSSTPLRSGRPNSGRRTPRSEVATATASTATRATPMRAAPAPPTSSPPED